jgi:hypothetical protein
MLGGRRIDRVSPAAAFVSFVSPVQGWRHTGDTDPGAAALEALYPGLRGRTRAICTKEFAQWRPCLQQVTP